MGKIYDFVEYVLTGCYILLILLFVGSFLCLWFPSKEKETVIKEVPVYEYTELTDWQMMQMAIIKTESGFNIQAEGKNNDRGIFQITPIYVKEVNRLQDSVVFTHEDAYDMDKSLKMFNIVQTHHNPDSSFDKALMNHNSNGMLSGYGRKVKENYDFIKNYEKVRKSVVNY